MFECRNDVFASVRLHLDDIERRSAVGEQRRQRPKHDLRGQQHKQRAFGPLERAS